MEHGDDRQAGLRSLEGGRNRAIKSLETSGYLSIEPPEKGALTFAIKALHDSPDQESLVVQETIQRFR